MHPIAIEKAAARLSTAQACERDLDLCTNFKRLAEIWYTFLISSNGVYTVLEKGAKNSAQSRQWFGGKKEFRRKDPLLQYLAQARDDDEHGLSHVLEEDRTVSKVMVNLPEYKGMIYLRAKYEPGKTGTLDISAVGDDIIPLERRFAHARLLRVHDRSGNHYDPPVTHLGIPVQNGNYPLNVANLALIYLEHLIQDASKLS